MNKALGLVTGLVVGAVVAGGGCDDDATTTNTGGVGGNSLVEDAGSISGLALINPTCGTGDGGTVSQECVQCATDNCSTDFEACFGTTWSTTLSGGICTSFGACVMACDCGDNTCFNDCLQQLDANTTDPCRSCVVDLVICEQTHCGEVCDLNSGSDAGQGGSTVGGGGPGGSGNQGGHGHGSG